MKNLLIITAMFLGTSLSAQTFTTTEGSEVEYFPNATGFMDCAIHFENLTNEPIILSYKKVSVDFPSTWDVSFCDNRNCFGGFVDEDTMSPIAVSDKYNSIKLTVYPNGKADTGIVSYAVWNKYNPSDIDTLTFKIYVRWSASNENFISSFEQIYPNPTSGSLVINSPNRVTNVEILDLQGKNVSKQSISILDNRIDLNGLPNGVYFLNYLDAGIKNSKKIQLLK
jgi:hypothetical protein